MKFDSSLLSEARSLFYKVYVDLETECEYIGSETATEGARVRIYATDWDYEEAEIFRSNAALNRFMEDFRPESAKICRLYDESGNEINIYYKSGEPLKTENGDIIEDTAEIIPESKSAALEICYSFSGCTGWQIETF